MIIQYIDVGDKVPIPNRRKGTIELRYSPAPYAVVHQGVNDNSEKRRSVIDTKCIALQTHSIDHAADIDYVEEQSEPSIRVHVPHHAGEHQPRVDAPNVTPVPIVESPQLTSVPNNDDGVVTTSRGRIIRKSSYFKDFVN